MHMLELALSVGWPIPFVQPWIPALLLQSQFHNFKLCMFCIRSTSLLCSMLFMQGLPIRNCRWPQHFLFTRSPEQHLLFLSVHFLLQTLCIVTCKLLFPCTHDAFLQSLLVSINF